MLIPYSNFNLDVIKKGDFWKITSTNFDSFNQYLQSNLPNGITFYIDSNKWGRRSMIFTYTNSKYIVGNIENCINFVLKKDKYTEINLQNFTTRCDISNVKSKDLMDTMDKVAILLNISRIYLEDRATTLENNIKSKLDLTLLTVMKDNKTFYEKYGYETCEPSSYSNIEKIDIQIHKKLLRDFKFYIFVELLSKNNKKFINKTLSRLRYNVSDFKYLHDFYTEADDYYNNEYYGDDEYELRMYLQSILLNEIYPWYSMVNIIQNQKLCMEKYF